MKKLFLLFWIVFFISSVFSDDETRESHLWLTIPEEKWAFTIITPKLEIDWDDVIKKDDGSRSRRLQGSNKETGINISVLIDPIKNDLTAEIIRDKNWPAGRIEASSIDDFNTSEQDSVAFVEYSMKSITQKYVEFISQNQKEIKDLKDLIGIELNQKHIHAYRTYRNYSIEIHLSKVQFQQNDIALFDTVLESTQIFPCSDPEVFFTFADACNAYNSHDFENAIPLYEIVMEKEKQNSTLEHAFWRILVDNLGMAYGISGDFENSFKTLQYGISQDPEYPMFYYNMACGYAESNDLKNAMANLKLAFKFKNNMMKHEEFPNPRTDDSFKQYLKNDEFNQVLKQLETN